MDVVAILLAAGESERMGRSKALVPWHGRPLLSHQLHEIQRSRVRDCVVVLGRNSALLRPLVRPMPGPNWKAREVVNARPEEGKCSSLRAGLGALWSRPDGILVTAVDQPLDHHLIDRLIGEAEAAWERGDHQAGKAIVLPVFRGRRGHPVLYCATLLGEMSGISEESEGLRAVVRRNPERVLEVPCSSGAILLDLNRPVDVPPPERDPRLSIH
jgi:molybdenum cofactor cytidylyltransferase